MQRRVKRGSETYQYHFISFSMSYIRSHAQFFFVDNAVIEYKFHSLGYDVVVVERAQNPMMQKTTPSRVSITWEGQKSTTSVRQARRLQSN